MQACEQGNEESSGLGESYNELTGHMTEASGQFFQHWLRLVELEEAPLTGKRAEIWASSGGRATRQLPKSLDAFGFVWADGAAMAVQTLSSFLH